jgi:hypothetical protein
MNKRITLDGYEVRLLDDVLSYILFEDDRELNDLREQMNVELEEIIDHNGMLNLFCVPKEYSSHVYVKAFKLFYELKGAENA